MIALQMGLHLKPHDCNSVHYHRAVLLYDVFTLSSFFLSKDRKTSCYLDFVPGYKYCLPGFSILFWNRKLEYDWIKCSDYIQNQTNIFVLCTISLAKHLYSINFIFMMLNIQCADTLYFSMFKSIRA